VNQILLLAANIILYLILLVINLRFKHSFDMKLERHRIENQQTVELFRDELFKKSRRFELKYEMFKNFTWSLIQIHWLITQIDWNKMVESLDNVYYQGTLVSNFYGKIVNEKLTALVQKGNSITAKRNEINEELKKISWEKFEIEEQKKYMNILLQTKPQNLEEIMNRIRIETTIKVKDEENFKKYSGTIAKLMKEITDSLIAIYPLCQDLVTALASELKEEYQI
jgi:hypothetical protein